MSNLERGLCGAVTLTLFPSSNAHIIELDSLSTLERRIGEISMLDVPSTVDVVTSVPGTLPTWAQTIIAFVGVAVSTYGAICEQRRKNEARRARRKRYDTTRAVEARK